MQPVTNAKKWVIWNWVISILTFVVLAPIAFIVGVFASDNASGASTLWTYVFILAPLVFFIFPILAQIAYHRSNAQAAKTLSIIALLLCASGFAFLGYILL